MKKSHVVFLAVFHIGSLFILGSSFCGTEKEEQAVVFIDLETVIAEEKKRIFSRVLRGEISREEAEKEIDRFFSRFGDALGDYEKRGFVVLDGDAVLGGGRDVTEEVVRRISPQAGGE